MLNNRSIPRSTVLPELAYPDVQTAAQWLCEMFGFSLRLGIGNHRAQLNVGDGAVIVIELHGDLAAKSSVMVRIDDVHRHHQWAVEKGVQIVRPPADYPYGERQYTAVDLAGHRWTFTQSIADIDPRDWGGTPGRL
jgi:uncharacterized glyoxalase superfamily protein PhnB